jgi:ABC-type multidrug transport system fused ATPase/permease subunit
MPEIWKLVKPFRWVLAGSCLLMIVNRICSLAVPISSRYLVNNVMYKHQIEKLPLIVGAVVAAAFIQGITTYILSQQLSIAGEHLIADLRMRVQQHISRLPISFFDSNRAGALVTRVMTDVEGVQNLVGAGLIDFAGGILTGIIALVILIRISVLMTILTCCILIAFAWFLKKAFGITRPIFRERSRITAEVSGRLTESLNGMRVVKGYHAETSEARVFAEGAVRLLQNASRSITARSFLSLCSTAVLGIVVALIMYLGAKGTMAHRLDVGSYVEFTMLLAFLAAPIALLVNVGTRLTETFAGLDRTFEILNEPGEDSESLRTEAIDSILGKVAFKDVT